MKMNSLGRNRQRGVALIVGLIFLVVLTIFVLGGLRDVLLQERMAGAFRNNSLASSAVDSLMNNSEVYIYKRLVETNLKFADEEGTQLDNETTSGNPNVRNFRNGSGYVTNSSVIYPVLTSTPTFLRNDSDLTSTRSTSGAYILEGPIVLPPPGAPAASGETHNPGDGGQKKGQIKAWRITARATGGSNDFVDVAEATYVMTN